MSTLIETKLLIMRVDKPDEAQAIQLKREPGYDKLREIIEPLLDGSNLEHVSVLADFEGGTNYRPLDMFVDDTGVLNGLPINPGATRIYRHNALTRRPGTDPETLPWIAGTAILFSRRVWF